MAFYTPPNPNSIGFSFDEAYAFPSIPAFHFGDTSETIRAIPVDIQLSLSMSEGTVSYYHKVLSQNIEIPISIDPGSIEVYQGIQSADLLIEAALQESSIFNEFQEIQSSDIRINVEISESLSSEGAGRYIFHFYAYTPPDPSYVPFIFGSTDADYRIASDYIQVDVEIKNGVVEMLVSPDIIPDDLGIIANVQASELEEYFEILSPDISILCDIQKGEIEEYSGIVQDSVSIDIGFSGYDIDGNIVTDSKLTKIPEIVGNEIGVGVDIGALFVGGGQYENLPITETRYRSKWKKSDAVNEKKNIQSWSDAIKLNQKSDISFLDSRNIDDSTSASWISILQFEDSGTESKWKDTDIQIDEINSSPFKGIMTLSDDDIGINWGSFDKEHNAQKTIGYLHPEKKDTKKNIKWDDFLISDTQKSLRYLQPLPTDKNHRTYWGPKWYSLFCTTHYYPPYRGENTQIRWQDDQTWDEFQRSLDFGTVRNFRCPWNYPYSGTRQPFNPPIVPGVPPDGTLIVPIQGYYYMANSTYIQRISGAMEDIDFSNVSMSIDRDSWLWSFNITILSKESLNLIKPQGSVFTDIEININGWKWTCRVEQWRETIAFGKKAWSVTGRSQSVEIGDPYYIIPAFTNAEGQGGQLIDSLLEYTGWNAEWQNNDFDPHLSWLIPANVINNSNTSPISIIKQIAGSVGTFVQTAPNTNIVGAGTGEKKLTIRPKQRKTPWNWDTQITPDVVLNDDICHEIGRSNTVSRPWNAAMVSGENQGCVVNVTRDGTAGDSAAPLVIDPLITSMESGLERARHIIGESGYWINHSLKLFSLMPPGQAPGLLLPGDFIDMNESGNTWRGQVTGTSISSGWTGNGLVTNQNIEVEQYEGE